MATFRLCFYLVLICGVFGIGKAGVSRSPDGAMMSTREIAEITKIANENFLSELDHLNDEEDTPIFVESTPPQPTESMVTNVPDVDAEIEALAQVNTSVECNITEGYLWELCRPVLLRTCKEQYRTNCRHRANPRRFRTFSSRLNRMFPMNRPPPMIFKPKPLADWITDQISSLGDSINTPNYKVSVTITEGNETRTFNNSDFENSIQGLKERFEAEMEQLRQKYEGMFRFPIPPHPFNHEHGHSNPFGGFFKMVMGNILGSGRGRRRERRHHWINQPKDSEEVGHESEVGHEDHDEDAPHSMQIAPMRRHKRSPMPSEEGRRREKRHHWINQPKDSEEVGHESEVGHEDHDEDAPYSMQIAPMRRHKRSPMPRRQMPHRRSGSYRYRHMPTAHRAFIPPKPNMMRFRPMTSSHLHHSRQINDDATNRLWSLGREGPQNVESAWKPWQPNVNNWRRTNHHRVLPFGVPVPRHHNMFQPSTAHLPFWPPRGNTGEESEQQEEEEEESEEIEGLEVTCEQIEENPEICMEIVERTEKCENELENVCPDYMQARREIGERMRNVYQLSRQSQSDVESDDVRVNEKYRWETTFEGKRPSIVIESINVSKKGSGDAHVIATILNKPSVEIRVPGSEFNSNPQSLGKAIGKLVFEKYKIAGRY